MKVKALVAFNSKLLSPCRKLILRFFKFKLRKPLFIRALRFRSRRTNDKNPTLKKRITMPSIPSIFLSLRPSEKKLTGARELSRNASDTERDFLFPSPITPAYVKSKRGSKTEAPAYGNVEEACRSFEKYLVEMIVEEGKMKDLMDVEEFLHCWKDLKSPVFIDLVCRFYGELCKDLFLADED